tara:strand:- start:3188 stop:3814 length:627 start_codon:yes stop_codon:yes gene_type:complete
MPFGLSKATVLGAAGSGGDGGAIQWIAGMNGTGSSYSLLFNSIPQTYRHLRVVMSSVHQTTNGVYQMWKINGNTAGIKSADYYIDSSTVYNFWRLQSQTGKWPNQYIPYTATVTGSLVADFIGYTSDGADGTADGSGYAQSTMQASYAHSDSNLDLHIGGIVWAPDGGTGTYNANPEPITSIEIQTDHSSYHWQSNTRVDLYGIGTAM